MPWEGGQKAGIVNKFHLVGQLHLLGTWRAVLRRKLKSGLGSSVLGEGCPMWGMGCQGRQENIYHFAL